MATELPKVKDYLPIEISLEKLYLYVVFLVYKISSYIYGYFQNPKVGIN